MSRAIEWQTYDHYDKAPRVHVEKFSLEQQSSNCNPVLLLLSFEFVRGCLLHPRTFLARPSRQEKVQVRLYFLALDTPTQTRSNSTTNNMAPTADSGTKRKRQVDGSSKPSKRVAVENKQDVTISLQEGDKWAPIIGTLFSIQILNSIADFKSIKPWLRISFGNCSQIIH